MRYLVFVVISAIIALVDCGVVIDKSQKELLDKASKECMIETKAVESESFDEVHRILNVFVFLYLEYLQATLKK